MVHKTFHFQIKELNFRISSHGFLQTPAAHP